MNTLPKDDGMTLRDYFAAQAMQAVLTVWASGRVDWEYDSIAARCYEFADAIIKARGEA